MIEIDKYLLELDRATPVQVKGRVKEVIGLVVKAAVPDVWIGELCLVYSSRSRLPVKAEVVGFQGGDVLLMPLGDLQNVGPQSDVVPTGKCLTVKVGPELLGRVLNGVGEPMDTRLRGPLECHEEYPVYSHPPDPLSRQRVIHPLSIGIRAIDALLTCGEGQRVGLFAAAGVGKSTLMGMIARNTEADVNVIAPSNEPSLVRLKGAYVATAVAESFRDQGKKVVLMMDSVTRFARAQREVGLACGEPPTRGGYTPSVFAELPKLLERSGNSDKGSITAFYTVLVAGDDMNEPVADEVRSILDGHIILSRDLAAHGHYPAIDPLQSVSRVMTTVTTPAHCRAAGQVRDVLATYEKQRDLILLGAYQRGTDRKVDFAIDNIDAVQAFLKQGTHEKTDFQETLSRVNKLLAGPIMSIRGS
jgi:flagellar biosynthesis/type III secretory pathway ATPase